MVLPCSISTAAFKQTQKHTSVFITVHTPFLENPHTQVLKPGRDPPGTPQVIVMSISPQAKQANTPSLSPRLLRDKFSSECKHTSESSESDKLWSSKQVMNFI